MKIFKKFFQIPTQYGKCEFSIVFSVGEDQTSGCMDIALSSLKCILGVLKLANAVVYIAASSPL